MKARKVIDSIQARVDELNSIHQYLQTTQPALAKTVKVDLLKLKAGHTAEKNAAHLIDQQVVYSERAVVLHDLRLEIDGVVAQIDHVMLNKYGYVTLFETKSFSTGLKVQEDGTFWYWDRYANRYVEIPSPILQSQRHEPILRKVLREIGYEALHFDHLVLVDYKASLKKPKDKQFDIVCRPDRISETKDKLNERIGLKDVLPTVKAVGRLVTGKGYSAEELARLGDRLAERHVPAQYDHWGRYGLEKPALEYPKPEPLIIAVAEPQVEQQPASNSQPLSSHKVARQFNITTQAILDIGAKAGLIQSVNGEYQVTPEGQALGAENRVFKGKSYVAWSEASIERLRVETQTAQ